MKPQKAGRMTQTSTCWTVALKLAAWTKPNFDLLAYNVRASCFEQVARFHTAKNGIATRYRFSLWTGPFRGCGVDVSIRVGQLGSTSRHIKVLLMYLTAPSTWESISLVTSSRRQRWNTLATWQTGKHLFEFMFSNNDPGMYLPMVFGLIFPQFVDWTCFTWRGMLFILGKHFPIPLVWDMVDNITVNVFHQFKEFWVNVLHCEHQSVCGNEMYISSATAGS